MKHFFEKQMFLKSGPLRRIARICTAELLILSGTATWAGAENILRNDRYTLQLDESGIVSVSAAGMPPRQLKPEFTVLRIKTDPKISRVSSHPNYGVGPRTAVRWQNPDEPLSEINAWLASAELKAATGLSGIVREEAEGRVWEFKNSSGKVTIRVTGRYALDTTRPFTVGSRTVLLPQRSAVEDGRICWDYEKRAEFSFSAELVLPPGSADPVITYTITPATDDFFSVAFTGAPDTPLAAALSVPQECASRGYKLFDYVMSEADLQLPRVHLATAEGNVALVADPAECKFRLPSISDSRFGVMITRTKDRLAPVLLAPLLGGPESKIGKGTAWRFSFHCVVKAGDWKETLVHIARDIHGFRDQRDNSGPGALNGTLERTIELISNRRGGNHAMWDPQQKYFDYFNDKTGVYKPFSPLYGLGAAIVTDDEDFFYQRALPQVEFALSRPNNVFAPYDNTDNKQANSAVRNVGLPYISYTQLVSLYELFQRRTPAFRALAEKKGPELKRISDALSLWRLTGEASALSSAKTEGMKLCKSDSVFGEEKFFDILDLAETTHEELFVKGSVDAAYQNTAQINLYPAAPDTLITADPGGVAFVHAHSFGRHKNQWGYPLPQPVPAPEQTVPAWRISRVGLTSPAYPIEYWMNTYGAMMRVAGLGKDDFIRDVARSGMVGRFGNFPGDNRSQDSLVSELPYAADNPPWKWTFATVNAGHAWDFVGAVIDFIVSDAFNRSCGAVDFPAVSAAGSGFRVRIYGAKPGKVYGDDGVYLWIPKGLVAADNRQIDWLAGHGNGNLYLVLWNQSLKEEPATLDLDSSLAELSVGGKARVWKNNQEEAPVQITGNRLTVTLPPKGIVAFAIPAKVKPRLQAKLYDSSVQPLGPYSLADEKAPFGAVHASLIRAGRDLTSAYVYTEALPENVISARLRWRQGAGEWQEIADDIYPYEFSPKLKDDGGDFTCVLEVEDIHQQVLSSPVIALSAGDTKPAVCAAPPAKPFPPLAAQPAWNGENANLPLPDDFVDYIQRAANENSFGKNSDGRWYPYSTPQGRRIAARQPIWDKALYEKGCTEEEARQRLCGDLARVQAELQEMLNARKSAVNFASLDQRQRETLLDLGYTEGVSNLKPELVDAVLSGDWDRIVNDCLYVRYAGHAPDHARNRAFAKRWDIR